uniref:Uncharacterized protein n=1 Tax=Arundo donax TaxID=35708 RepID=A0A0A9GCR6_ARUDO
MRLGKNYWLTGRFHRLAERFHR